MPMAYSEYIPTMPSRHVGRGRPGKIKRLKILLHTGSAGKTNARQEARAASELCPRNGGADRKYSEL